MKTTLQSAISPQLVTLLPNFVTKIRQLNSDRGSITLLSFCFPRFQRKGQLSFLFTPSVVHSYFPFFDAGKDHPKQLPVFAETIRQLQQSEEKQSKKLISNTPKAFTFKIEEVRRDFVTLVVMLQFL